MISIPPDYVISNRFLMLPRAQNLCKSFSKPLDALTLA